MYTYANRTASYPQKIELLPQGLPVRRPGCFTGYSGGPTLVVGHRAKTPLIYTEGEKRGNLINKIRFSVIFAVWVHDYDQGYVRW